MCKCLLEVKELRIVCMTCDFNHSYAIAQIESQLEWELKPLQTTRVSECHGSGHIRVCLSVLTMLQFTTNLREAHLWCTQWTIQQQPVPTCLTFSATQSTPFGFKLGVAKLVKHLSSQRFFYPQEVCTCNTTFYQFYCSMPPQPLPFPLMSLLSSQVPQVSG